MYVFAFVGRVFFVLFFDNGSAYGENVERVIMFIELSVFFNFYGFPYGTNSVVFYFGELYDGFEVLCCGGA